MAAAINVVCLQVASGYAAVAASPVQRIAAYNGLRASPMANKQTASLKAARAPRRLTISNAASKETLENVCKIISEQLAIDIKDVVPEATFDGLGADSLDTVEVIMELEKVFEIDIDQEKAPELKTVQQAADLIQDLVSAKANA